jgi:ABC-type sugar transport system ATPase subunit
VLRDGRRVWSGPVAETDEPSLVRAMVGKDVAAYHRARERVTASGSPLLSANKLATRDGVIHDASLSVRAGTILGVFGVVGAGKSELLEAVFGMRPLASGSIQVEGRAHARWGPRQAIDAGLALVPEDRLRTALLTDRSIAWNVALPYWRTMRRLSAVAKQEGRIGQAAVKEIGIRAPSAKVLVANLSGGNKQKVSVGRWIGEHTRTRVFLFDEPTQGLDVGAREEVYILMRQLAERGAAIIVASSDLDELLALADEFVVMRSGTTAPIDPKMHNAEDLLAAAT